MSSVVMIMSSLHFKYILLNDSLLFAPRLVMSNHIENTTFLLFSQGEITLRSKCRLRLQYEMRFSTSKLYFHGSITVYIQAPLICTVII